MHARAPAGFGALREPIAGRARARGPARAMSPTAHPRIVGIAGSLRKDSYCSAVLRALARDCEGIAAITIQSLRDIPLYDGDLERAGLPKPVIDLKSAIADADGVIIVSSEFLHGIPGVLKNALDWTACPNTSRALSRKPRIIIADELSLGLAPLIVEKLLASLRGAAADGSAVLLVEQHIRQALAVADYAHVMRRGRIELSDTAVNMLERIDEIEHTYLSLPTVE